MRHVWAAVSVIAVVGVVGGIFGTRPTAQAEDAAPAAAKPAYAGSDSCKKCHFKQNASWKKTPMAQAFEVLKPDAAAEKKTAGGLDPKADYTKDVKCLKCHTTGYGTESGYPAPAAEGKAWTPAEEERAKLTQGGTCEACHGPGTLYGPYKKEHPLFKFAEIEALGAVLPKADNCMPCHVKECPAMPKDYAFDFEKAKASKDIHEHIALKNPH
jgi:hypothetical protein